jgi:predicted ATPase
MAAGKIKKLVLTGGPCAGKSTIAELVSRAFSSQLMVVPESASLLFRGGFPRWQDVHARTALQSAIYHVQVEIEAAYEARYPGRALLLDRGTVDGAAYWPLGANDFFTAMDTAESKELERYDEVIYLESAGEQDYSLHKARNPARTEAWAEARDLDSRTRAIWEKHPRMHVVPNQRAFSDKIFAVLKLVENCLKS